MTVPAVRPVVAADLPALGAMVAALAAHHGDLPQIDDATLARDVLGPTPWLRVLVAETDGRLCGYAAMLPRAQLQFGVRGIDIHHLYVAPDARGQGIGRHLVAACLAVARTLGCAFVTVDAAPDNTAAQASYAALGFERRTAGAVRFVRRLTSG